MTSRASVAAPLLAWFDRAGRKHLPWQQDPTPYRVWVSEIMLQQTQVATVIRYYERFMQRFPDVRALAAAPRRRSAAPVDRSRLLRARAQSASRRAAHRRRARRRISADDRGGAGTARHRPLDRGRDPRVGARAATSDSRRQRQARARALLRRRGISGRARGGEELWSLADECTPAERVAHYTQAIMDLGATLCVRSRPLCARVRCGALRRAHRRPAVRDCLRRDRRRSGRSESAYVVLMVRDDGAVLLERRPPAGIWGGLWTLPQFDEHEPRKRALTSSAAALREEGRRRHRLVAALLPLLHSFRSHAPSAAAFAAMPATAVAEGGGIAGTSRGNRRESGSPSPRSN